MKKLLILILVIATICSYTISIGFAAETDTSSEEEITIDTFVETFSQELRQSTHANQTAVKIQYNQDENKVYLIGELDPVTKYWRDNKGKYLQKYQGLTLTTTINIDFKVDQNKWRSEYIDWQMDAYGCPIQTTPLPYITSISDIQQYDTSVNIMLLDLAQYKPEEDTHNLLSSIIQTKNNVNTLDCTNSTLYIKIDAQHQIEFDGNSATIDFFGESISSYTNGVSDAVVSLPMPILTNATFNTETMTLYLDIAQQTEIINLLNFGHDIMLQLQYQLNEDEPSPLYYAEISNNKAAIKLPIQTGVKPIDILKCNVAYYDPRNPTESSDTLWSNFVPQYAIEDSTDDFPTAQTPSQAPTTTPTTPTSPNTNITHKCGLCGVCPVQPLNICLWMWGCISIAAIAIIACVVSIIVDLKNKKS